MTDLELPAAAAPLAPPDDPARIIGLPARPTTARTAVAAGRLVLGPDAFASLRDGRIRKGDALTVAEVAGVFGAKHASRLLPLCHDVLLQNVELDFELDEAAHAVEIRAVTKADGPTGVEMEALTAVTVAALTLYDLCSPVSREIAITDVRLLAKTGGQSGDYRRPG